MDKLRAAAVDCQAVQSLSQLDSATCDVAELERVFMAALPRMALDVFGEPSQEDLRHLGTLTVSTLYEKLHEKTGKKHAKIRPKKSGNTASAAAGATGATGVADGPPSAPPSP